MKGWLTIRVGRHGDHLGGGPRSVPVDGQNPNRVLRELVESVHLVVEPAHLHALKNTDPDIKTARRQRKKKPPNVRLRGSARRSPAPSQTGSRSTAAGSPGQVRWEGWAAPSSPGWRSETERRLGETPPCWEPGLLEQTRPGRFVWSQRLV